MDEWEDVNAGKPFLVEALEENLADDPYGTAVYVARRAIREAIKRDGLMSEQELKNLVTIEETIRTLDNA
jgi:hypothetical protein